MRENRLLIGTEKLRNAKLTSEVQIEVDKVIKETQNEKLLSLVINNVMNHLYGDLENDGLMEQLLLRIRMLKRISKYMTRDPVRNFVSGLFNSKLLYGLPVFGTVIGLEEYKEMNSRYTSFTMKDNKNLQVLQNKVNRLLLGADNRNSTGHQLHVHPADDRISHSPENHYFAERLKVKN